MAVAVLAPGFGGTASQPLLVRLGSALAGIDVPSRGITFSTKRPSRDYAVEIAELAALRDELVAEHGGPAVLIGRSYGGRICCFLAQREPPVAVVVLGHPISPPNRPRLRDEEALAALTCPTLIVQGDRDELGPLAALERVAAANPRVELSVIAGAGHDLPEREAVSRSVAWVARILAAR